MYLRSNEMEYGIIVTFMSQQKKELIRCNKPLVKDLILILDARFSTLVDSIKQTRLTNILT